MYKRLILAAVTIVITAAALMTGIFTTTLTQIALAQRNSTNPATSSNIQSASPSNRTGTDAAESNFLVYENSTFGMKLQYPSNWAKQTAGQAATFVLLGSGQNNPEQFFAKLNVTGIMGFPPNVPLKAMADRVVDGYRHFLSNFQIESYTNTTLGGNNDIKIVYTYSDSKNTNIKATDIATVNNDRLYVIQYYAESPKYQTYLPTLQKMIDSFQITK
ncbi:MAG: PsbP-related protein [Nitrososphaeraceae archaeon]